MNLEQSPYNFDNFKETPLWELAQAVRADDVNEIKQILKDKKLEIDLKEPKYNQTLLSLAIQNEKRNAFLELLNVGASPNELVGNPKDATPFIYGIKKQNFDCNLFYAENMLQHGANPNLEIINPKPQFYFENSFPLLAAIGYTHDGGKECLDLVKLLVDNGAGINCCYKYIDSELCEGVITKSLMQNSIETLKYFVIEKKINIPNIVIIYGEEDKSTRDAFGLRAILISKYYKFEDYERDGKKYDESQLRKTRDEILEYLDKINK